MNTDSDGSRRLMSYEPFTPSPQTSVGPVRWVEGTRQTASEGAASPEPAEPEWSTEALFDCYNG